MLSQSHRVLVVAANGYLLVTMDELVGGRTVMTEITAMRRMRRVRSISVVSVESVARGIPGGDDD